MRKRIHWNLYSLKKVVGEKKYQKNNIERYNTLVALLAVIVTVLCAFGGAYYQSYRSHEFWMKQQSVLIQIKINEQKMKQIDKVIKLSYSLKAQLNTLSPIINYFMFQNAYNVAMEEETDKKNAMFFQELYSEALKVNQTKMELVQAIKTSEPLFGEKFNNKSKKAILAISKVNCIPPNPTMIIKHIISAKKKNMDEAKLYEELTELFSPMEVGFSFFENNIQSLINSMSSEVRNPDVLLKEMQQ